LTPSRRLLLASQSALLLVVIMFVGSVVLWIGVPVGWLWVGSRLQASTSLATAIGVMMLGMFLTVCVLLVGLARVNRRHVEMQEARGVYQSGSTPLELVLVGSAVFALIGFVVWFFGFSGSAPFPLQIGY
jgi:heme/copper-type cytochrome/quinol oxidase subunit 2